MSQTNKLVPMLLAALFTTSGGAVALRQETTITAEPQRAENSQLVHPVLLVPPNEGLGGKVLEPSQFKKMNGLLKMSEPFKLFDDDYEKAEREAGQQFCDRVTGLRMADVELLAGPAYSKGGDAVSFPVELKSQENWLYIFGLTPELVRLYFENGICTQTSCQPYDLDPWYCFWRKYEIRESAPGKTVSEVLAAEGPPSPICLERLPKDMSREDRVKIWKEKLEGQTVLHYDCGSGKFSDLVIKDGRCTGLPKSDTVRAGKHRGREEGVSFKMP